MFITSISIAKPFQITNQYLQANYLILNHFENCCAFAPKPFTMNFIHLFSKYCLKQFFAFLDLLSVQLNLRDQMARAIQTAVLQLLLHHTFSVWLCGLTRFHASDCLSLDPDQSDDNITKVIKAIV